MTHTRSLPFMFLLLSIPAAVSQTSRDPAKDRAAVTDLEEQWLHSEHDAAVLGRILAADFVHVVPVDHFLTRQEHIDWAVKHPDPKDRQQRFDKLNIRLYGDVAIVNGSVIASSPSGKEDRTMFTDVFVFRDGRWQAVNAQENAMRPTPQNGNH